MLAVNLTATMKLCKGVMRGMMKARWGRIINVSSIVGTTGNPGQANYAASKAGLVAMSKSLAYEVASRGITVNAIAPGFIAPAMTDKLNDQHNDANMLSIGARVVAEGLALDIVDAFLDASFDGGRHTARVAMIENP